MTCKDLGGPCDLAFQGETADEIIVAQDQHLSDMTAAGDQLHAAAAKEMKGRWKRPISGMKWYKATKADFASRPNI
ncbi:MAG: hypothetical protein R2706_05485 [Acidimicrobiales bacterium]